MGVGFGTVLFGPFGKDILWIAPVILRHRPRARECVIDNRDLVVGDVGIGFVDVETLRDDGLVVPVQRQTGGVKGAGTPETARLRHEDIKFAISVFIYPLADGRARPRW